MTGTVVLHIWQVEGRTWQTTRYPFVLRGPAGWNHGSPASWYAERTGTGTFWLDHVVFATPVAGQYTLTTAIQGTEVSATFTIPDARRPIGVPPMEAVAAGRERVTITWGRIADAVSYTAGLFDLATGRHIAFANLDGDVTRHVFEGLTLSPGRYRARVWAATYDKTRRVPPVPPVPPGANLGYNDRVFSVW